MKTIEYSYVDKSSWPRGEWDTEVDKRQWLDEATGLPCLIVRGPHGGLCGYVGVAEGHPLYEVGDYKAADLLSVHGGITFNDHCGDDEHGICHKVEEGESDNVWWLGFDCAHSGDLCPTHDAMRLYGYSYRNMEYVTAEVTDLAMQLAEMDGKRVAKSRNVSNVT